MIRRRLGISHTAECRSQAALHKRSVNPSNRAGILCVPIFAALRRVPHWASFERERWALSVQRIPRSIRLRSELAFARNDSILPGYDENARRSRSFICRPVIRSRADEASFHLRGHDEVETRRRAGAITRREMGRV